MVEVEVVYAKPDEQVIVKLSVPESSVVVDAINASGLLGRFLEIALSELKVGIFGEVCKLDRPVSCGDRIEIYRPLLHDPKEARRQRALRG